VRSRLYEERESLWQGLEPSEQEGYGQQVLLWNRKGLDPVRLMLSSG